MLQIYLYFTYMYLFSRCGSFVEKKVTLYRCEQRKGYDHRARTRDL